MSSANPESKETHDPKSLDPEPKQPSEEAQDGPEKISEEDGEAEEEEGECGFCLFMKAGGCKETFIGWENCISEAEEKNEDIVEKCFEATSALKKCMEAHADYYEPILRAEKRAEEEALKELENDKEKEKEKEDLGSQKDSKDLEKK